MTPSDPTFYRLFRRGRYGSAVDTRQDPERAQRSVEQRECFAVAAVGFCLKHDAPFAKHFWEKVCQKTGDPDGEPSLRVEVGPEDWADLRLTAEIQNWKRVCVVECKAGAPLREKQNPDCAEFNEFLKVSDNSAFHPFA